MSLRPPILVTGATGFLGLRLVPVLHARGRRVHALAREGADRDAEALAGVTWHGGDLLRPESLQAACAALASTGPFDIVHGAALVSYRRRDAALARRVNVEGTRSLLDAALRHGARRVVHVGSVVAVGCATAGRLAREDMAWNGGPLRVDYSDTKRAAEELALEAARELDLCIVDPGAIFGPGPERSNSVHFLRELAGGRRMLVAPPGGVGAVGVDDVAEGIALALERGRRGERYLLVESNLEVRELLDLVLARLGRPRVRATAPRALWRALELLLAALDRPLDLRRVTAQSFRMLGADWRSDASRARDELGWRPRPIAEVLDDTLAELGLVPRASEPERHGR